MQTSTTIVTTGRVTADFELQTSQNNNTYVQFFIAVNKGYGEHQHANFFQCTLFGNAAQRILNAKVRKGSLISVTGDLDLVEYTRVNDGTKGMIPKINVFDWSFAPTVRVKEDENASAPSGDEIPDGFEQADCGNNGLPFD